MDMKKLQALYGLKLNPFSSAIPIEGLQKYERFDRFKTRIEDLAFEGGYAAVIGDPGLGKSCALRLIAHSLSQIQNLAVGELTRPQASVSDFYRELGDLFRVPLKISNKYEGAKQLRTRWQELVKTSLFRPVLLIDEAQSATPSLLNELKSMNSERFDSRMFLTVIFAGDMRFNDQLRTSELKPIDSRINPKMILTPWEHAEVAQFLKSALTLAGAPSLMTPGLIDTLSEKAMGNLRSLRNIANELLLEGAKRDLSQLDEKLFFDVTGDIQFKSKRRARES